MRAATCRDPLAYAEHANGKDFRLFQADSLELMSLFEPESFDLISVDPPYFLSNGGTTCKSGKRASVGKGDWDVSRSVDQDHAFNMGWLRACQRVLKPTGTIWVSGTHHVIFSVGYAMQRLGFKILNSVTWFKPNASPNLSCRYFTHSTEIIIWAAPQVTKKLQHTFNYKAMKAENGGKQMRDIWTIPPPGTGEKLHGRHPTQKPIALLNRIVQASTKPGDKVLDPFCGSGTSGVAALKHGCTFTGVDLDQGYLEIARRRIEALE